MNNKQAKRLRKMAATSGASAEDNYEAIRTKGGSKTTTVLAECQKALYRELKKGFKKENGCNK